MSDETAGIAARRRSTGVALAALALGHLAVDAYSSGYAPLLPVLRDELGLDLAQVGWCTAVLTFSSSLLQPLYGWLSDRLRSRYVLALAPAVSGVGLGALAWSPSYLASLALLFVTGVGIAAYHPQGAAQVTDVSRGRPGLFMGLFLLGGMAGFSLGPLVVGEALSLWGRAGVWRVAGPGLAIALVLAALAPRPLDRAPTSHAVSDALRRHRRPLLLLYLLVVIRGAVQLTFTGFLALYWVGQGLSLTRASVYLTAFLACGAVGGFLGGYLVDFVAGRHIIRGSMLASPPLFVGGMLLSGSWQVLLLGAGIATLLLTMSVNVLLAQRWVPEHRSTISSLMMGFAWGVGGVAAPLVGHLGELIGLGSALLGVGALPVLGVLLAWKLPPTPPWR